MKIKSELDMFFLREAVELSKNCIPSQGAYSVGSIIIDEQNNIISTGFSRETANNVHAEEVAINKAIEKNISLLNATLYATMEPCGLRLSGKLCCAQRIINAKIKRVVYGIKEPTFFVKNANGIKLLLDNNVLVEQMEEIIPFVLEINKHIK